MSSFFRRLLEHKKNFYIMIIVSLISGLLFGFSIYHDTPTQVQDFFKSLFYFHQDGYTNNYTLYVLQNAVYLFLCTYLSTSYLGFFGIMMFIFLKGLQISFSLFFVYTTLPFSFVILILISVELLLELILCAVLSYMCMYMSVYVLNVTFFVEQNFNIKSIFNYQLNSLILSLVVFSLSLAFRIYIIPMF